MTDETLPPAGWYPAAHANGEMRYWDGVQWRKDTSPPLNLTDQPRSVGELGSAFDPIVVPGWLGPARLFVLEQGRAYVFGAFTVTEGEYVFSDASQVLLRLRRDETRVEWPRWFMGGAIKLTGPGVKKIVAFGRPFPDAPSPEPAQFESAADALDIAVAGLGDGLAGTLAGIGGDLIQLVNGINDVKSGKAVGERIRSAIENPSRPGT